MPLGFLPVGSQPLGGQTISAPFVGSDVSTDAAYIATLPQFVSAVFVDLASTDLPTDAAYLSATPQFVSAVFVDVVAVGLTPDGVYETGLPEFGIGEGIGVLVVAEDGDVASLAGQATHVGHLVAAESSEAQDTAAFRGNRYRQIGSRVLYRAAFGLERALADVDSERLIELNAELVRDQWDVDRISARNLPFLAFACGVNLWEDDWDEAFRRYWVDEQWTLQQQRGSYLGMRRCVEAVGGTLYRAIRPPATFFLGKSRTDAEKAAFLANMPQLRVYAWKPAPLDAYRCYASDLPNDPRTGAHLYPPNGSFIGPHRRFFARAGQPENRYQRTSTLWDRGTETSLTLRQVVGIPAGTSEVTVYDEVALPGHQSNHWYVGQAGKFPLAHDHTRDQDIAGIFLGARDATPARIVRVPRDETLTLTQGKVVYQTIQPSLDPITVYPDRVAETHAGRKPTLCCGGIGEGTGRQFLRGKFLPQSIAFRHLYERWYLYDETRVPEWRKAAVYVGRARLGIHAYTAELHVGMEGKFGASTFRPGSFVGGFMRASTAKTTLAKLVRAVRAGKALRDQILIDTAMKKVITVGDNLLCDGSHVVGEIIDA